MRVAVQLLIVDSKANWARLSYDETLELQEFLKRHFAIHPSPGSLEDVVGAVFQPTPKPQPAPHVPPPTVKPRTAKGKQPCPHCGKKFAGLRQHINLAHPDQAKAEVGS